MAEAAVEAGIDYRRQACAGHGEDLEQPVGPVAGAQIHEQRAAGVRDVGNVAPMAGELEQQPAVYRAEGELAALRARPSARNVVEQPGQLGAGKIRIEQQPGASGDFRFVTGRSHALAVTRGAPILPDDGRCDGLARGRDPTGPWFRAGW